MKNAFLILGIIGLFSIQAFAGAMEDAQENIEEMLDAKNLASGYFSDCDQSVGETLYNSGQAQALAETKACAKQPAQEAAYSADINKLTHQIASNNWSRVGAHSRAAWDAFHKAKKAHEAGNERLAQQYADKIKEHTKEIEKLAEKLRVNAEEAGIEADNSEIALEQAQNC